MQILLPFPLPPNAQIRPDHGSDEPWQRLPKGAFVSSISTLRPTDSRMSTILMLKHKRELGPQTFTPVPLLTGWSLTAPPRGPGSSHGSRLISCRCPHAPSVPASFNFSGSFGVQILRSSTAVTLHVLSLTLDFTPSLLLCLSAPACFLGAEFHGDALRPCLFPFMSPLFSPCVPLFMLKFLIFKKISPSQL